MHRSLYLKDQGHWGIKLAQYDADATRLEVKVKELEERIKKLE